VRILGVDPGSVTTGFGVIDYERGRLVLVEQGSINTKRGAELSERLVVIHDGLREVIARTSPQAVAVETPFAGNNVKSLIQLAHARGVMLLAAQSRRWLSSNTRRARSRAPSSATAARRRNRSRRWCAC
jgi:crossover junction endodeoxyribonuclease RuvC